MCLRSISTLFFLFFVVGCGVKISTLHIPTQSIESSKKVALSITSKLRNSTVIGYIDNKKREPIITDSNITECVRTYFLQKLPQPHMPLQVHIVLKNFQIVLRGYKVYGYANIDFKAMKKGGVLIKRIVVRQAAIVKEQKDLELFVIAVCKEAAKIMKEQYALFAL